MSVREYIGARYIPLFADPIEWDDSLEYEPLTVVKYQGASYVSRQQVPEGIPLSNEDYWILWADYNAQLEAYRREVQAFDGRITTLEGKTTAIEADNWVTTNRINAKAVTTAKIDDAAVDTAQIADSAITSGKIADGAVGTSDIADGAVTSGKIADGAVGTSDIAYGAVTGDKIADAFKKSITTIGQLTGSNFVVFGDSFTQDGIPNSDDGYWFKQVCYAFNANRFNYAVAGAGFGRSSNLMLTQVNTAISEMTTAQKNNTSVVFLYAGYNDILNDVSDTAILEGIEGCVSACVTAFPYAKIILVPFNWGYSKITPTVLNRLWTLMTKIKQYIWPYRVQIVENACWWNFGIKSHYLNQGHPNTIGYRVVAANMVNAIMGGNTDAEIAATLDGLTSGTGDLNWSFKNGLVTVEFWWQAGSNLSNWNSVLYASSHPLLKTVHGVRVPLMQEQDPNAYAGHLYIASSGAVAIRINSYKTGTQLSGHISFMAQADEDY